MHIITKSCVLLVWMHSLTVVQSKNCTLEQFLNGDLFDSNFDTTGLEDNYPSGKQIRVSCSIGYSGFFKLHCDGGVWKSKSTKCQPRSCGHPGDAPFADFHLEIGEDFVFGSQVKFTCHKGYQMVSRSNRRRCLAEGWDGVVPVCEAQQCRALPVNDNVQVIGDPEEANFGNVVRFRCKSSSHMLFGSQEVYCDENGEWSGGAPKCDEIKCLVTEIENGNVLGDTQEYKEHEILHFECEPGFKPTEARSPVCTKLGMRADWSPTPACELITCKLSLPPVYGTEYEPATVNVFSPGGTVRVTCGDRHWISDPLETSAVVSCKSDGQWSLRPICKEVTCSNRRHYTLRQWSVYYGEQKKFGDRVTYQCKEAYKSTGGATSAVCTRGGWKPDPLCQEITCDRHEIPNTDIVNSKYTYKYREQVNYVCKNGYKGQFHLTCDEYGWSGEAQCKESQCEHQDISDADIVSNDRESYSHNEQVQYMCRKNNRRFTIVCENGVWTGIENCSGCPNAEVSHGFYVGPYNDTLYYTCDEGYKLVTDGWWAQAECHDGVWSGLDLCIANNRCGKLPVIPNGGVKYPGSNYEEGQRVTITCNKGYRVQVKQLTCHNGEWKSHESSPICAPLANPCSPPPKVKDAVVENLYQREFLSGSEVTYQCRHNHTTEADTTIRCNDGNWETHNIVCAPVPEK
nr:PREDICTED: complement factor H-like [Paralichthys olivaceus]